MRDVMPHYLPDTLVVKFRQNVKKDARIKLLRGHKAVEGHTHKHTKLTKLHVKPEELDSIKRSLRANPDVEFVGREWLYRTTAIPNDPSYALSWHLQMSDMYAPVAWDISKGGSPVGLAIIDTGLDTGHPDFVGKIAGGYCTVVDPVTGLPFPWDKPVNNHGTSCASVAAVGMDNGIGTSSPSWNGAKIHAIRAAGEAFGGGSFESSSLAEALTYCANNPDIKVISMSLGLQLVDGHSLLPAYLEEAEPMRQAILQCWNNGKVIFAAVGNGAYQGLGMVKSYPAQFEHVIGVQATEMGGRLAGFSCFSESTDIAAPGEFIHSAVCRNSELIEPGWVDSTGNSGVKGDFYGYFRGTSAACPVAAGALTYLWSINPSLTNADIVNILFSSSDYYGLPGAHRKLNLARGAISVNNTLPVESKASVVPKGRISVKPLVDSFSEDFTNATLLPLSRVVNNTSGHQWYIPWAGGYTPTHYGNGWRYNFSIGDPYDEESARFQVLHASIQNMKAGVFSFRAYNLQWTSNLAVEIDGVFQRLVLPPQGQYLDYTFAYASGDHRFAVVIETDMSAACDIAITNVRFDSTDNTPMVSLIADVFFADSPRSVKFTADDTLIGVATTLPYTCDVPASTTLGASLQAIVQTDTELYSISGNTVTLIGPIPPPSASPKSGRYSTAQLITLTNIDGMIVLYTLDGSDPRSYIVTDNGIAQFDNGVLLTEGDVIT